MEESFREILGEFKNDPDVDKYVKRLLAVVPSWEKTNIKLGMCVGMTYFYNNGWRITMDDLNRLPVKECENLENM